MKIKRHLSIILILALLLSALPCASFASGEKLLALTFDDGPGLYTDRLLDILAERGVKATFFIVGQQADRFPDVIRRMYEEGHQLASHTYGHVDLKKYSEGGIVAQLQRTADTLDRITGVPQRYVLRPPYGSADDRVLETIGVPAILWSIDPADWKYRDAQIDHDNVLEAAKDGGIILLHDIHEQSVEAVPSIIDDLSSKGYQFVTVNELFRRKGVKLEPGKVYRQASGETLYSSEDPISRGQLVFELYKIAGSPKLSRAKPTANFSDIEDHHNAYAVKWAALNGLVRGYPDGSFRPDKAVSRQDFSVIYCRFARFMGWKTEVTVDLANYPDGEEVAAYAGPFFGHMIAAGLLKTDSEGRLQPRRFIGYTEAVSLLLSLKH